MLTSSPVSNDCLQQGCQTLKRHMKLGGVRIPPELRGTLESLIERMERVIDAGDPAVAQRVQLMREFETLDDTMRGRTTLTSQLYSDGMLGVIRAWDPVTIQECIDYRWIAAHTIRYEERAQRALARLKWFMERCGLEEEVDEQDLKPWQLPYAHLDVSKELLWGRIRRSS